MIKFHQIKTFITPSERCIQSHSKRHFVARWRKEPFYERQCHNKIWPDCPSVPRVSGRELCGTHTLLSARYIGHYIRHIYIQSAHRLGRANGDQRSMIARIPESHQRSLIFQNANRLRDTRHSISWAVWEEAVCLSYLQDIEVWHQEQSGTRTGQIICQEQASDKVLEANSRELSLIRWTPMPHQLEPKGQERWR